MVSSVRRLMASIAFISVVLFAFACNDGEETEPLVTPGVTQTAEPSPAAGEVDLRDLLLQPKNVPSELAQLGEPEVGGPELFFGGQAQEGETTQEQLASWGFVGSALQLYNAPEPFPTRGARFMVAGVHLTNVVDGAKQLFACTRESLDRQAIADYEAQPGREVVEYQELTASQLAMSCGSFTMSPPLRTI